MFKEAIVIEQLPFTCMIKRLIYKKQFPTTARDFVVITYTHLVRFVLDYYLI